MGPQSLLHVVGDRGTIETFDLAVREDVSKIFWAAISHTHRVDTNVNFVFVL